MIKLFIRIFLFIGILSIFNACDSTNSPSNPLNDSPVISDFSFSPSDINFQTSGAEFKDTTVVITLSASVLNLEGDSSPLYSIVNKQNNEIIYQGNLQKIGSNNFEGSINFRTSTSSFGQYIINLIVSDDGSSGNYAQGMLTVSGVSNNPPVILEVNNPVEFQLPSSGSETVKFTAKVTDEDGQNSILGVFLRLISRSTGEVESSPFRLYDDGLSVGDEVANDSLYTLTFPVSSTNQPDTYDILYYAIDQGGLVSDTVKTTFSIVE